DRYSGFSLLLCMNLDKAYLSGLNGDNEGWQLAVFMKFSRDHEHLILESSFQYNIQLSN
ncbi:2313_t:CDS:1, partial [Rhizophagus irregularis]